MFVISGLHVRVGDKEILRGVDVTIKPGEVHALMGPNGSGKSTLAATLMGHPGYTVTSGSVTQNGEDVLMMKPDERSKAGLFLSFQYPQEIAGLSYGNFLRTVMNAHRPEPLGVTEAYEFLTAKLRLLGLSPDVLSRGVNEGFSGGEKKRAEMLQLAVLEPSVCILDETDSGLDIDALKAVAAGINALRSPQRGWLIITHYRRLLDLVKPDRVSVLVGGRIQKTGGPELVEELEKHGYESTRDI